MSVSTIRDDIYDVLATVDAIGTVHLYERWAADWGTYLDYFTTQIDGEKTIRGAMIMYRGFEADTSALTTCSILRVHRFDIALFVALNDGNESELDAADLLETLVNDLDTNATLNGSTYLGYIPSQVAVFENRVFGDVLCHYAEISKQVPEEFTWA